MENIKDKQELQKQDDITTLDRVDIDSVFQKTLALDLIPFLNTIVFEPSSMDDIISMLIEDRGYLLFGFNYSIVKKDGVGIMAKDNVERFLNSSDRSRGYFSSKTLDYLETLVVYVVYHLHTFARTNKDIFKGYKGKTIYPKVSIKLNKKGNLTYTQLLYQVFLLNNIDRNSSTDINKDSNIYPVSVTMEDSDV